MPRAVTVDQMVGILRDFERNVQQNAHRYAEEITNKIKLFIILTRTIDRGDLYVSLDFEPVVQSASMNFMLEFNNPRGHYEGFVEFDRPAYNFKGRKFIEQGIKAADIERISNEIVFESFQ